MASSTEVEWILYYWPGFPGRGEFVRLVFEEAGVKYTENNNAELLYKCFKIHESEKEGYPMLSPPVIEDKKSMIESYLKGTKFVAKNNFMRRNFANLLHIGEIKICEMQAELSIRRKSWYMPQINNSNDCLRYYTAYYHMYFPII